MREMYFDNEKVDEEFLDMPYCILLVEEVVLTR